MRDQTETHRDPVNVYRAEDRLTVATPMPRMVSNEDIAVDSTADNRPRRLPAVYPEMLSIFKVE